MRVPNSLLVVDRPDSGYIDQPPAPYVLRRWYRVLDQFGDPMRWDIPGGLFVHEEYSNYQGSCSLNNPSTGADGFAPADGVFLDHYQLLDTSPNPCTSTATQKIFVKGILVATFFVRWTYDGVTVQ